LSPRAASGTPCSAGSAGRTGGAARESRCAHLLELLRIELAHALVLAGNDDVDAVRLVADVLVDPLELDSSCSGGKPTAPRRRSRRLADRRDHVAAVAEGEDGKLDASGHRSE
jgi:hypothetical protein